MRKRILKGVWLKGWKGGPFRGKAQRGTERVEKHFRIGESRFIPQP